MSFFAQAARADINRYLSEGATSARSQFNALRFNEGLQAILVYRFGRLLVARKNVVTAWPLLAMGWLLYALAAVLMRKGYGIHLSLTAEIAPGFYIGHFGGIEVANCRIGERCSVGQLTKIGRPVERDGPQIGNGVWIGAHAKLFGPIKVGDNATIAPGARVTKNIQRNSLVVGDPGRVVFGRYDNSRIVAGI